MASYAALLRGIMPSNPAMSNARLRGVFEGLGLQDVRSVLASGNIVFRTEPTPVPELEAAIQQALRTELDIPGGTVVREGGVLRALLDRRPFGDLRHQRGTYLTVTFLMRPPDSAPLPDEPDPLTRVVGYDAEAGAFLAVVDNSDPRRTPDFMGWLQRTWGEEITTRTWLTVQRIVAKLDG